MNIKPIGLSIIVSVAVSIIWVIILICSLELEAPDKPKCRESKEYFITHIESIGYMGWTSQVKSNCKKEKHYISKYGTSSYAHNIEIYPTLLKCTRRFVEEFGVFPNEIELDSSNFDLKLD